MPSPDANIPTYIVVNTDRTFSLLASEKPASLETCQKAVNGMVEEWRGHKLGAGLLGYVNENGKLTGLPPNPTFPGIAGNVLIGQENDDEGEFKGLTQKQQEHVTVELTRRGCVGHPSANPSAPPSNGTQKSATKFLDRLRLNPIVFDGASQQFDFDVTPLLHGVVAFDINQIALQMIEDTSETPGEGRSTTFTPVGLEWLKFTQDSRRLEASTFVGIIPPFQNCWFEYQGNNNGRDVSDIGVLVASMSPEWIARRYPQQPNVSSCLVATVFFGNIYDPGGYGIARETLGIIPTNDEGQVQSFSFQRLLPPTADPTLLENQPHQVPLVVTLVALMLLNFKIVKSTQDPEPVKSRQQRRYEARKPHRVHVQVRYHVLELDTTATADATHGDGTGLGGWEQAWHRVRGHIRHYKSGKTVVINPYSKGNPLKGVVLKDYALKA